MLISRRGSSCHLKHTLQRPHVKNKKKVLINPISIDRYKGSMFNDNDN